MDLTQPVTYRTLTINAASGGPGGNNPISGVRLTRAKFSDVSVHGYVEKKSLSDGMDASDVYMGQRNVVLTGEVFAATKGDLFDFLDALRLKFTPTDAYNEDPDKRGYLPLNFWVPTGHTVHFPTGLCERVLFVRPAAQPDHTIEFGAIGGADAEGYVVPFTASLEAKDPRFYHPWDQNTTLSGLAGGSGSFQNRGNYYAPLNFILQPSAGYTAQGSFTFSGVGSNFDLVIPGSTSERIVRVDSVNKVVTYTVADVETLRMDLITFNGGTTWPQVPPTPEGESLAGFNWSVSNVSLDGAISRAFFNETWA